MVLLTNIIDCVIRGNNNFCCLCLSLVRPSQMNNIQDEVTVKFNSNEEISLCDVLQSVLNVEVDEYFSTFETICKQCIKSVINTYTLIQTSNANIILLSKTISHLADSIEDTNREETRNKTLYVSFNTENCNTKHYYDTRKVHTLKTALRRFTKLNTAEVNKEITIIFNQKKQDKIKLLNSVHSQSNGIFKCKECSKDFPEKLHLKTHYAQVHLFNKYKCSECPLRYDSKQLLKAHKNENHTKLSCVKCGKLFTNSQRLRMHELSHNLILICPDCGRKYKNKTTYRKHIEQNICKHQSRASPADAKLTCDYCNKKYTQKMSLRVHIQFEHLNYKAHVCDWCGKKFWAQSRLKAHIVKHTRERNFICTICGGLFVTKEALLYHTRLHTGEKPYKCPDCNSTFLSSSRRSDHIKRCHSNASFACDVCGSKFNSSSYLEKHKRSHLEPNASTESKDVKEDEIGTEEIKKKEESIPDLADVDVNSLIYQIILQNDKDMILL